MNRLLRRCSVCSCVEATPVPPRHKVALVKCVRCGTLRQSLDMTAEDISLYYEQRYFKEVYTHAYVDDCKTAELRLKEYRSRFLPDGARMLDVGCGTGAFVERASLAGYDAYGCDIAQLDSVSNRVYREPLQDIHFPTDYFDVVTLHDVLEHIVNPADTLREVFRVLKQEGTLVVELPNFFGVDGGKHWKPIEHLWYWTPEQFASMAQDIGFVVDSDYEPVTHKRVYLFNKPEQKRVRILVPPGIGDAYWSIAKLQSFCERNGLGLPDVYISSPRADRDRSYDFVQRAPFLNAKGYRQYTTKRNPVWTEAYMKKGRTVFERICSCDYFLAYNGMLRYGYALEEADSYEVNWHYPMFVPMEERRFGEEFKHKHGEFLVGYFITHGVYKRWVWEFPIAKLYEALAGVAKETNRKIVLIGADWDVNSMENWLLKLDAGNGHLINMVGQTNLSQAFGLLRASSGVIGYPSGMTIMATVFKRPTVMLWNDYFHEGFHWRACPPASRGAWYEALNTKKLEPNMVVEAATRLMERERTRDNRVTVSRRDLLACQDVAQPGQAAASAKRKHKTGGPRPVVRSATPRRRLRELTVACVLRSGSFYDAQYVLRLRNSVARNLTRPYSFRILTDTLDGEVPPEEKVELVHGWPGWWSKLELFRPKLFAEGRVLYFDLDTLIVGNIDHLANVSLPKGELYMLRGFRHPARRGSGVMVWEGQLDKLYNHFVRHSDMMLAGAGKNRSFGDQLAIKSALASEYKREPLAVQDICSGIYSYKNHCREGLPEGARIVCFHGEPRIHNVTQKWVVDAWK